MGRVATPTNSSIDQRVARVESDLGKLSTAFDGFRVLIDERFHTFGETLHRIESAVTAPNAADATTAVTLADHARRLSDQEARMAAQAAETTALRTAQTAQDAKIGTVGAGVRWVGFGGVITLLALVAGWVVSTGRIP